MNGGFRIFNRQKVRALDQRFFKSLIKKLLDQMLGERPFDLSIHLVNAVEMAKLNQSILQHAGSTDVITLDYSDKSPLPGRSEIVGEIYISLDDAVKQSREFGTGWTDELVRYVIHGVLHLQGFDDLEANLRRTMKQAENRHLRELRREFLLSKVAGKTKVTK